MTSVANYDISSDIISTVRLTFTSAIDNQNVVTYLMIDVSNGGYEIFSGAVMNVKVRADERQNNRPKKQCVLRLVQNRRFFYKGGFCHFVSFSSKKLGA